MGRGGWGGGMMGGGIGQRMQGMSEADKSAFFEARIAAIKAGLMLTDAQLQLWPAVEAAVRDMRKQRTELAERIRREGQPANPVDRMKRAGEIMSARGATMTKMASAMKPFHDSLSEDQKRRLQILMRPMGGRGNGLGGQQRGFGPRGGEGNGQREGMRGEFRHHWQRQDGRRESQGEGRRWRQDAPGDGFGPGGNRGDWRRM